ncbi:nuclear transport factor 2 family protein [Glutamicibacter sp.]|uniref:nuclear transport factor 2 family protein n=1 Tax=Glutamicibacter sp. TaxID=1931995 RepID=UPI0028BE9E0A|nr:nuclear transport factor 2 family protein [Glutamicibacter sp.]
MAAENSANKATVRKYIDGFNKNDHAQILSCLTEDIVWTVYGHFRLQGKQAYDAAIENENFSGYPELHIVRMVEEGDTIMAEIHGRTHRAAGDEVRMVMGEVFVLREHLICERRAFVINLNEDDVK